jgi:hypothetical protein
MNVDKEAIERTHRVLQLSGDLLPPGTAIVARGFRQVPLVGFEPLVWADQAVLGGQDEPWQSRGLGVRPHLDEVVRGIEILCQGPHVAFGLHAPHQHEVPLRQFGSALRLGRPGTGECGRTSARYDVLHTPEREAEVA